MNAPYRMNGHFVVEWFEWMVSQGKARRVYEGGAGFMGLAKVRILDLR
jgi:hypothetical protein